MGLNVGEWWGLLHSLAAVWVSFCLLRVHKKGVYLAAQSSVPRARPVYYVRCVRGGVGYCAYVKQRLNSRGVLGGLLQRLVL